MNKKPYIQSSYHEAASGRSPDLPELLVRGKHLTLVAGTCKLKPSSQEQEVPMAK